MKEAIRFPENVEVGKFYDVPHVWMDAGRTYTTESKGGFIPINTHLHSDEKLIGFKYKHWHIDWRFVDGRLWKQKIEGGRNGWSAFATSEGKQEVANVIIYDASGATGHQNTVFFDDVVYRRVKCKRHYRAGSFHDLDIHKHPVDGWVLKMPKVFCNSKLKEVDGKLICPHKGAHIDRNCKDSEGNYVCPAHLLKFDPITLKVVQPIRKPVK
jgi:hypothetical protein